MNKQYNVTSDDRICNNGKKVSENFLNWFSDSQLKSAENIPDIFYHGTSKEFENFKDGINWFSESAELANEYADYSANYDMRDFAIKERGLNKRAANIIPVYLRSSNTFNSDGLETATVVSFFNQAVYQAKEKGREFDEEDLKILVRAVRAGASIEESGPHYSAHDFWQEPSSFFGTSGATAIKEIFHMLGYDSISYTENGHKTVGVFNPSQIKSAVGNSGLYAIESQNISDHQNTAVMPRSILNDILNDFKFETKKIVANDISSSIKFEPVERAHVELNKKNEFSGSAVALFRQEDIDDRSKVKHKSREKMIEMRIDDFIELAETVIGENTKTYLVRDIVNQDKKFNSLPQLNFYVDNGVHVVKAHDGRHRAKALKEMGFETMPVVLLSDIRWYAQCDKNNNDYLAIWPEKLFGENGTWIDFPVSREDSLKIYEPEISIGNKRKTLAPR